MFPAIDMIDIWDTIWAAFIRSSGLFILCRKKMAKIRDMGMDPFGNRFERTAFAKDIKEKYADIEHEAF